MSNHQITLEELSLMLKEMSLLNRNLSDDEYEKLKAKLDQIDGCYDYFCQVVNEIVGNDLVDDI